jgi:hypothetical protein
VVWSELQARKKNGTLTYADWRSRIMHWDSIRGVEVVKQVAAGEADRFDDVDNGLHGPLPGLNHISVDWPQVGFSSDGTETYVCWLRFTDAQVDTSAHIDLPGICTGVGYGDIMASLTRTGDAWGAPQNVTNTPTTDERFFSLAPRNAGGKLHLVFSAAATNQAGDVILGDRGNSTSAGNLVRRIAYLERTLNGSHLAAVGDETPLVASSMLLAAPNPSVAGVRFALPWARGPSRASRSTCSASTGGSSRTSPPITVAHSPGTVATRAALAFGPASTSRASRAPRWRAPFASRYCHSTATTQRRNTMRLAKAFALTTLLGIALATSAHASEILAEHVTGGTLDLPWIGGFQTSNNVMYGKTLVASDPGLRQPSGDHTVAVAQNSSPDSGGIIVTTTNPGPLQSNYAWEGWIFTGNGETRRGLLLRADPTNDFQTFYMFVIEPGLAKLRFRKFVNAVPTTIKEWLAFTDIPAGQITPNAWHKLKVVADGNQFTCSFDDVVLPGQPIVDSDIAGGYVGVYNFRFDLGNVPVYFDDLVLSCVSEVTASLEVEPHDLNLESKGKYVTVSSRRPRRTSRARSTSPRCS